ncbi:MAG TPA: hypothetical protein VGI47_02910 [Candidatus Binataceae bacterium]|jgi:hypothetical protein
MIARITTDELEAAIDAHARAFAFADPASAESFVVQSAIAAHREASQAAAARGKVERFEVLARARLGPQIVVKVRFRGASGATLLQNRWAQLNDGPWRILEVEDLTAKLSPWADIAALKADPMHAATRRQYRAFTGGNHA